MKELSLNILDITENSVKAGSSLTEILIDETADKLTLKIADNGCGMSREVLKSVADPFYTTRTTRKVGLGVPFLKLSAEMTGGSFSITSKTADESPAEHGTTVTAVYNKNHIDFTPLGDIVSTVETLINGHPETDFLFVHKYFQKEVRLDTREMREQLGNDVPLNCYEVLCFVKDYLNEQYSNLYTLN